jgi:DNA repair ATPase RecN
MQSLDKFNTFVNNLNNTKGTLLDQQEQLELHLAVFQHELNAATLMEDNARVEKAKAGIAHITKQLSDIATQLGNLDGAPLAQDVLNEAEERLANIRVEIQKQWVTVFEARDSFISAMQGLGKLRQYSIDICNATGRAAQVLKRNPLAPGGFNREFEQRLPITFEFVKGLLKI